MTPWRKRGKERGEMLQKQGLLLSSPSCPVTDACQSSIPALFLGKPQLPGLQTQRAHEGICSFSHSFTFMEDKQNVWC